MHKVEWPNLKCINLEDNLIESLGISYLIQAYFPNLQNLVLNHNQINNPGIKILTKGKWSHL